MKVSVNLSFWFDGIDTCSEEEVLDYLATALDIGAESTCSDIKIDDFVIKEAAK